VDYRRTAPAGSPAGRGSSSLSGCSPVSFRRLFLEQLQGAFDAGELGFFGNLAGLANPAAFVRRLAELRRADWVVYAKRPFGGPEQVLAYLGRYTHRVAISNSRLLALAEGQVTFRWRDYRHHNKAKRMTLTADEFIRRFLLHALPDGFHRIRHYGLLANRHRGAKLALCRQILAIPPPNTASTSSTDYRERYRELTGRSLEICPCCGGRMQPIGPLPRSSSRSMPTWCDSS
jgi:hypothetical protein